MSGLGKKIYPFIYVNSTPRIINKPTDVCSFFDIGIYDVNKLVIARTHKKDEKLSEFYERLEERADSFFQKNGLLIAKGFGCNQKFINELFQTLITPYSSSSVQINIHSKPVLPLITPFFAHVVNGGSLDVKMKYRIN